MIKRLLTYALILSLICSPVFGQDFISRPKGHGILEINGSGIVQAGTGTLAQTYAGTNRTRTNSAGNNEAIAANTPVIDHIGASLTPALRVENERMQLLFEGRTFTEAAGWELVTPTTIKDQVGSDGTANSATRVIDASGNLEFLRRGISKSASDSTTYFQAVIKIRKETSVTAYPQFGIMFAGTSTRYGQYTLNPITGLLTAKVSNNAASIGYDLKDHGNFYTLSVWAQDNGANAAAYWLLYPAFNSDGGGAADSSAQGSCVIDAAMLTTGSIPSSYFAGAAAIGSELIATQADRDFSAASNWANVDINAYDETGDLTITANASGQYCTLPVANAPTTATTTVVQLQFTIANIVGTWDIKSFDGTQTFGSVAANGTYYLRFIPSTTGGIRIVSTAVNSSGDFDNFSLKTCGTVRLTEAGTVTMAFDAAQTAALSGTTGQGAIVWIPGASKAALSANHNIFAWNTGATNGIYLASADGAITISDGTNTATTAYSYVANTPCVITWYWAAGKIKIGAFTVAASSVTWGSEANYDGSFNPGANAIFGAGTSLQMPNRYQKAVVWDARQSDSRILTLR